ncbi:helix-turn-helix transcriptional regulator [Streptomyces sp. NPDC023998]|uniref:helix-turn-helix domain-containing protein n=1 Tax=Streptomyces sp. NPDC023998 TaxID=3154597 RepID=UPI0033D7F9CC
MGDLLAVQPGRIPAVGLGPMLNAARLRRGWRLREAARPLGLSASYLLDVEAGPCRPSRAVADLLADGLQLNDPARAHLFACGESRTSATPRGAQPDSEDQEPRRGAGLCPRSLRRLRQEPPRTGLALCWFVDGGRHMISAG